MMVSTGEEIPVPVYERGGKCYAQVSVKGKPKYGPRRPCTTEGRRLAIQDEADLIRKWITEPQEEAAAGMTIAEFRELWKAMFPRGHGNKLRQASTWVIYMERTKAFAEKYGERPLKGGVDRRTEARPWVIEHPGSIGPLRTMFNDARRDDETIVNPFAGLQLGRSEGRKRIKTLDYEQMLKLLDVAHEIAGPAFRAMCAMAAVTALREAETFALSPVDVNFTEQEVTVAWQFRSKVKAPNAGQPDERWAPPKNGEVRTVALPPLAAEALRQVPVPVDGPLRPPDGAPIWLLTPDRGAHFTVRTHDYYWRQVRAAAGFPKMQFHELKHFAGWYMLNVLKIEPHYIAHQLAHKDTDLLFDLYGHPEEQVANDAIKEAYARANRANVRRLQSVDDPDEQAA